MKEEPKPIPIYIDGETTKFGEALELLLFLNDLYVSIGGDRLVITNQKDLTLEERSDSPYDIHKGTEFANTKKTLEESMFPGYVPRQEVYDAIKEHAKPSDVSKIKEDINKRFPNDEFGDVFPYSAVFNIIYSEHLAR